ncbi:methylenetetrahydrofolate reductase 1 [Malassezia pachydermatis]|uniref:Methylenetetrahydrofolate reductase n=1 Tax=Malassezia pachydermatis TaxID=77020 RepID=A0A0M9VRA2_9BASI|nr:methylenetetrahydrofolate reductase [Malassezia pachydermatis]KOS16383.1 methylenetetrahydrofolate reductase [Malassezia pachydermatis]
MSPTTAHGAARIDEKILATPSDAYLWSLEFFPPKTTLGLANLCSRIERMVTSLGPGWVHVTWGTGGTTRDTSLELAARVQLGVYDPNEDYKAVTEPREHACNVCLHLTCTNVDRAYLDSALDGAKRFGIRNILALRGDPPRGEEYWVATDQRFQYASDLVRYIKEQHGDYFCIGVAGYPEGHAQGADRDVPQDMKFLKAKQDAGAQFIVTQLFYDASSFARWYHACRAAGITVPIIPGIMPIQNYTSFRRMANLCGVRVPADTLKKLEPIKMDDAKVKEMGIELSIQLIREVQKETGIHAFHMYTLNLEKSVTQVARAFVGEGHVHQGLGADTWDEFPNGRYTDARSPAFGEVDGYGASLKVTPDQAIQLWGTPVDKDDISKLFVSYVAGELSCMPWCDSPVWEETARLLPVLRHLNAPHSKGGKGWWTVGSQPAVDGCDSSDPTYGFGPQGGYIFQKAFVELFLSEADKQALVAAIAASDEPVTYFAGTCDPASFETNVEGTGLNTVTWGVFPGREVAQSTIIEEASFRAWREEAFAIWHEWEMLFPPRSATRQLLHRIHDERWLITVVHHNYKDPDALWKLLDHVVLP